MEAGKWIPIVRNYEAERESHQPRLQPAPEHPLIPSEKKEPVVVTPSKAEEKKTTASFDPLGASDPLNDPLGADLDPLSFPTILTAQQKSTTEEDKSWETFTPWEAKKSGILQKFTASGKLSITTSFLSSSAAPKVDKTQARLESLEDEDENSTQTMLNLSQQEYVKHIDDLQQQLVAAWDTDQRVKALKIAIQFYPSKFVLITEILDTFGKLVFDRIFLKAANNEPGTSTPIMLKENFTPDQVNDSAKETCKNWFFKIASIRELLPRIYVEMAILKCYRFLAVDEYSQALVRLSHMIRGVGDPLVATYCRAYLCRKGIEVAPKKREHLLTLFYDFAFSQRQLTESNASSLLTENNITYPQYLELFVPGLEWILQCIAHKAEQKVLESILEKYMQYSNNALVLDSIISSFSPEYVAAHAVNFADLISKADCSAYPQYQLYFTLGVNLVLSSPPKDVLVKILNHNWPIISKVSDPASYMKCAETYIEIPSKHMTAREVNTILGDIIQHITPERAYENLLPQLQSVVDKILTHMTDFSQIFGMSNFIPLLDMFQATPSMKVEVCKSIMSYFSRTSEEPTQDLILISGLLFVAKTLHDSVSALTFEDEKRQISELILNFIKRVSYGRDFEEQLNFYVTCRASFTNLDAVLQFLVHSACQLVMKVRRIIKGNHTRKTAAFVRAGIGYCYITIPSIVNAAIRLSLYLLAAQVALVNHCIPQAEATFKAAVTLISELSSLPDLDASFSSKVPESMDTFLVSYLRKFSSALIMVPGHPEAGPFYLVKGLINAVQNYQWMDTDGKIYAFIALMDMLAAARQSELPLKVEGVELNDVLFDGDDRYFAELDTIAVTLYKESIAHINAMVNPQKKAELSLHLFNRLLASTQITDKETLQTLAALFQLAKKGSIASNVLNNSIAYVAELGKSSNPHQALAKAISQ